MRRIRLLCPQEEKAAETQAVTQAFESCCPDSCSFLHEADQNGSIPHGEI